MTVRKLNRREILLLLTTAGVAGVAWHFWPEDGIQNRCTNEPLPQSLANHRLLKSAWDGIDPSRFRDSHVHLIGLGDSGSGVWINPQMNSPVHPIQWMQRAFYLNASCTKEDGRADQSYVEHLLRLSDEFPAGARMMLMAFDYFHNEDGEPQPQASAFYTPDSYAASVAQTYAHRFEWIASIHPYRTDAVEALQDAVRNGARAVKWLPPAQGMDPASALCDPFYEAAAHFDIPLLVHSGTELAVHGGNTEDFGNPLRLRRPLEHGVRVIAAHCASLGSSPDLDKGPDGPRVSNFALFERMMEEPGYADLLFGDLSAITQVNRVGTVLESVIQREEWQPRLLNGSDYPLPGVLPLFSLKQMVRRGFITREDADVLSAIRLHNPLLFDFALKRALRVNQSQIGLQAFQTSDFFNSRRANLVA